MERVRIRINRSQRELEVEGDEAFVTRWIERIDELLSGPSAAGPERTGELVAVTSPPPVAASAPARAPMEPFGQFLIRLPKAATEVDRMLAAGWWVQRQSGDDAFATADASRLLSEHGVRIGNPSQAIRQSLLAKRLFLVQKGRHRVSIQGRDHLERLLGSLPGI